MENSGLGIWGDGVTALFRIGYSISFDLATRKDWGCQRHVPYEFELVIALSFVGISYSEFGICLLPKAEFCLVLATELYVQLSR